MSNSNATGCGGCLGFIILLILLGSGPPGWTILIILLVITVASSSGEKKKEHQKAKAPSPPSRLPPSRPLLPKPELNTKPIAIQATRDKPMVIPPPPPPPPPTVQAVDQELDWLLKEAKESIDRHNQEN
jgi:hypothetical protein